MHPVFVLLKNMLQICPIGRHQSMSISKIHTTTSYSGRARAGAGGVVVGAVVMVVDGRQRQLGADSMGEKKIIRKIYTQKKKTSLCKQTVFMSLE